MVYTRGHEWDLVILTIPDIIVRLSLFWFNQSHMIWIITIVCLVRKLKLHVFSFCHFRYNFVTCPAQVKALMFIKPATRMPASTVRWELLSIIEYVRPSFLNKRVSWKVKKQASLHTKVLNFRRCDVEGRRKESSWGNRRENSNSSSVETSQLKTFFK